MFSVILSSMVHLEEVDSRDREPSIALPYVAIFFAGTLVMMMELSAGRVVAMHLGQSIFTWTSVIGVVLAGISLGNYVGGRIAARFACRRSLPLLFAVCSVACLSAPVVSNLLSEWQYLWEFSHPAQILIHVTGAFLLPAVAFGVVSPVAAEMAIESRRSVGRTMGSVYAWGACGSIVGTFLTGFYLVDALGASGVFFLVAGVCSILSFGYANGRLPYLVCMLLILSLVGGLLAGLPAARVIGEHLGLVRRPDANVLLYDESQYSAITVKSFDEGRNIRAMYLDKMAHSKTDMTDLTELLYKYWWVYEAVLDKCVESGKPVRALVIGGGAYTFPQYIALTRPGSVVDVAEIDPAVTRAAVAACGYVRRKAIREHNYDARNFVSDLISRKRLVGDVSPYRAVCGDTFNDYSVPYHLTTKEFHDDLSMLMADDGVYMLNMIDRFGHGRFLASIVSTLRQTFPSVQVFFCHRNLEFRGTYVVVCSKADLDLTDVVSSVSRRHPEFGGRLLTSEEVEGLLARAKPIVLTDDYAPVENLLADVVKEDARDELTLYYLNKGLGFAEEGNMEKAARYFEKSVEANPGNLQGHYNLGVARMRGGEPEAALKSFQVVLRGDRSHIQARNNAAVLLSELGQSDAAEIQLRTVLDIKPDDIQARLNLASLLISTHREGEAKSELVRVLEIDPENRIAGEFLKRMQ
ncbi:MAG: fused MFS/spermidine synthase [Verrucomicrobia bacterium]|nr:fused MFS/spermidine synthase [Verrucomicrobiota bacterium]